MDIGPFCMQYQLHTIVMYWRTRSTKWIECSVEDVKSCACISHLTSPSLMRLYWCSHPDGHTNSMDGCGMRGLRDTCPTATIMTEYDNT